MEQDPIDEQRRLMPERRQLSLTQIVLGKPIPIGLVLKLGMRAWIADILLKYSMFHFVFVNFVARVLIS